jgi:hypothetical protein
VCSFFRVDCNPVTDLAMQPLSMGLELRYVVRLRRSTFFADTQKQWD